MKIYIIGIDFGIKVYSILHTKIIPYLKENFNADIQYVEWLSKKDLSIDDYNDGDAYVYVGIEEIYENKISFKIFPSDSKKEIVSKFSIFLEDINSISAKLDSDVDKTSEYEHVDSEEKYNNDLCEYKISKYEGSKSSLVGIKILINNEEHYISKEDFVELYKLDEMLKVNNISITEIVVEKCE